VLYLANDPHEVNYVAGAFGPARLKVEFEFADSFEESRVRVRLAGKFDVVVVGWSMPDALALTLLHKSHLEAPGVPVIVAGERSIQQFRDAGAFACVGGGTQFVSDLPRMVESAARQRRAAVEAAAPAPPPPAGTSGPARVDPAAGPAAAPPDEAALRKATRVALVGNAAHLVPASVATGEDSQFRFVAARDPEQASSADVVVVDQGDHILDVRATLELLRAGAGGPLVVLLVAPNEPISRDLDRLIDDFHPKAAGWVLQLPARLRLTLSRAGQMRAAAQLRGQEDRLRTLIALLPSSVVQLNHEGHIEAINPAAAALLGASTPDALLGTSFATLVAPQSRDAWSDACVSISPDQPTSIELHVTGASGEHHLVEATLVGVQGTSGGAQSAVVALRALSEPRQGSSVAGAAPIPEASEPGGSPGSLDLDLGRLQALERELLAIASRAQQTFAALETDLGRAHEHHAHLESERRTAQARLEAVERERWQAFDAFTRTALSGIAYASPEGRLLGANPAFAAMLGYGSADEMTAAVHRLDQLCVGEGAEAAVARWCREAGSAPLEVACRRKDGTPAIMHLHAARVPMAQAPGDRLLIVAEDISERRRLERHVRRAMRWEQAFKATAGLAADITHALQAADEPSRRLHGDAPDRPIARRDVDALLSATSRALALSSQLLAYGGRQSRAIGPVDLNDIVRATETIVRRTVDEAVDIAFELAPAVSGVEADRHAVEELVLGAVHAASAALPIGGRLTIRTANAHVTTGSRDSRVPAGDYVVLTASAAGWGLDRSSLGADSPAASSDPPSGGLATVTRLTARLGGTLTLEGTDGESLTLHVYLPSTHG
jgi:PAS domain S-box-containing protein